MKKSIKSIVAATLSIFAIAFSLIKLAIHFQPNIVIDKSTKIYNTTTPSYEESKEEMDSKTLPNPDLTQKEEPVLKEDDSNLNIEENSQEKTSVSAVESRIVEKKVPEASKESEEQQTTRKEEKDSLSSEPESETKTHRPTLTQEDISDLENLSNEMDQKISQKKAKKENEKKKINDKDIKKERKDKIEKNMNDLLEEMDNIIDE